VREPKVVIYPDRAGEWRWRLVGGNGEIEASGEGHSTYEHAEESVTTTAKNFAIVSGYEVPEDFILAPELVERLESVEEAEGHGLEVG
jgi:uncharacterized protein YegP (UPF0339 family)